QATDNTLMKQSRASITRVKTNATAHSQFGVKKRTNNPALLPYTMVTTRASHIAMRMIRIAGGSLYSGGSSQCRLMTLITTGWAILLPSFGFCLRYQAMY